jgi:hypothetical protein
LVVATVAVFGMLLLYFLSVAPLAVMYVHVAHVPGINAHWTTEQFLGLLPGLGGAMLCNVLEWMTEHVGYWERSSRDFPLMLIGFLLTFVTVFSDLVLTLYLAEGTAYDESFHGAVMNYDRALARELFYCLVPGYVFCVAVIPSNLETVGTWILARLLIRSNSVPLRVSEKYIAPPPFELAFKYTDVLTGISAMLCMLPFMSPRVWQALAAGVLMVALVYLDSHWKVLRCYMLVRCNSERMAWNAMRLFAMPLTILAASAAFWGWEADIISARVGVSVCAMQFCVYMLALHMVAATAPLAGVGHHDHGLQDDYVVAAKRLQEIGIVATYLNTNPVHCLRAKYLDLDEAGSGSGGRAEFGSLQECVPFRPGKEHLLLDCVDTAERPRTFLEELSAVIRKGHRR